MHMHRSSQYVGFGLSVLLLIALLVTPFTLVSPVTVQAATIEVTNGNDSGPGSLRQAIADAAAGDTIAFAANVNTVTLTSDELFIDQDLIIDGGSGVTIERSSAGGTPDFRIFIIGLDTTVLLKNLTITNGKVTSTSPVIPGGGIFNDGTLTVENSTLSGNSTDVSGGGIGNGFNGILTVENSTLRGNSAHSGGGISNESSGTVTVTNSTISGNVASSNGGGGIGNSGTVTVTNSTISGNTSQGSSGGGIYNVTGTVEVTDSTISDNVADVAGGGIFSQGDGAVVDIVNSTIIGNTAGANSSGGGISNNGGGTLRLTASMLTNNAAGNGGGMLNDGTATVANSTISGNVASSNGGGVLNLVGMLEVTSSTLRGNTAISGGGIDNQSGTITMISSTLNNNAAAGSDFSIGFGGGIRNSRGTLEIANSTFSTNTAGDGGGLLNNDGDVSLTNSTLSDNVASQNGGGIFNFAGTVTITNTIVANSPTGGNVVNNDSLVAAGANIVGMGVSGSGSVSGLSNISNANARLGPLTDNGGPTLTHLPQADSPAIDAGVDAAAQAPDGSALTTDQRGFARIVDDPDVPDNGSNTIDIGAVEVQDTCFAQAYDSDGNIIGNAPFYSSSNAQALRDALAIGGAIRVAGFCSGAVTDGSPDSLANVAVAGSNVSLIEGGYPVDIMAGSADFSATPDPDTNETVLSAQGWGRVIYIDTIANTVVLSNLTIRDGDTTRYPEDNDGSGIYLEDLSTLVVTNSIIANNDAEGSGGGIFSSSGSTVEVRNSTFSGNLSRTTGGGIFSSSDGIVEVDNSTFSGNVASLGGGGLYSSNGGTVTVNSSTFSNNTSENNGGGIVNDSGNVVSGSSLIITNSTLRSNAASNNGGGIVNTGTGSRLNVTNSTISGNSVGETGGGILSDGGLVNITNSTISGNSATSGNGGGISNLGGTVTLVNAILADSTSGGDYDGFAPTLQGSNIVEDGSVLGATAVDPQLGPLTDNGGPTLTHLPQADSPAIDAGVDAAAQAPDGSALTTDQRGFARIVDDPDVPDNGSNTVDIGAVEVRADDGDGDDTPSITANFATGAPGSAFVIRGQSLPPGVYEVLINGRNIGTATVNASGDITFVVLTSGVAAPGLYRMTLRVPVAVAQVGDLSTQYTLDADAPLRTVPDTVTAPTFNVPATIDPVEQQIYLPLVRR